MLTHPKKNRFMVVEAISGLNLDWFDQIYFICLQEHEDTYQFSKGFCRELGELGVLEKSNIVYLEESTASQSETVWQLLNGKQIEGFVFVKDSDNFYQCELTDTNNQVAYFDLNSELHPTRCQWHHHQHCRERCNQFYILLWWIWVC